MVAATEPETPVSYDINIPYVTATEEAAKKVRYPEFLPSWEKVRFPPLPPFEFNDPALRVRDRAKPNLLQPNATVTHIQRHLGSIVDGVQLSELSDVAKDELALLVAERKVVVFPDQDLIDAGPARLEGFMKHFGKLNYQPVSGTIPGYPSFHIIHRSGNRDEITRFLEQRTSTTLWHQDVSYEHQPPGYTMLGMLEGPDVGGDTIFAATDDAYKRLSPTLQSFIDKLRAVHSASKMIAHTQMSGGLIRKTPANTVHPVVRVHPVTNEKCIFFNGEFITKIESLKDPEAKMISDFLLNHLITGHDFQARVKWQPRSIVLFDNRSTIHTAVVDYLDEDNSARSRHIFRLCAMAERPEPVPVDDTE